MRKLLIDGDLVGFRCAASAENDGEGIAIARLTESMQRIFEELGSTDAVVFLTGPGNFRKEVCPDYKANRTKPAPVHLAACREFLIENFGAIVCEGHEADDALGYSQGEDTVIVSYDKDLQQIAGQHYNFVKGELTTVTEQAGLRHFYEQMLVGDKGDNIIGVAGIGKVKAPRILEGCETEEEMFDTVRELYADDARFFRNGQLLWIWKTKGGIWNSPLLSKLDTSIKPGVEALFESTPSTEAENIPSTEHGGMTGTSSGSPVHGQQQDPSLTTNA